MSSHITSLYPPPPSQWGVFTCGHPLCMECTIVLVKRQPRPAVHREAVRVKCPLCREYSLSSEINYVQNRGEEEMAVQVKVCVCVCVCVCVL